MRRLALAALLLPLVLGGCAAAAPGITAPTSPAAPSSTPEPTPTVEPTPEAPRVDALELTPLALRLIADGEVLDEVALPQGESADSTELVAALTEALGEPESVSLIEPDPTENLEGPRSYDERLWPGLRLISNDPATSGQPFGFSAIYLQSAQSGSVALRAGDGLRVGDPESAIVADGDPYVGDGDTVYSTMRTVDPEADSGSDDPVWASIQVRVDQATGLISEIVSPVRSDRA